MPRTDGAGAQNRDWPESLVGVFRHFKIYAEANAKKDSRFFRGGVFAALSLASVFVFAPENLGWNPTANGIGRNIMRDDAVCPDNAVFSDRYAIANEDIRPDPHIIANNDIIAERGHRSFILEMKLMQDAKDKLNSSIHPDSGGGVQQMQANYRTIIPAPTPLLPKEGMRRYDQPPKKDPQNQIIG